MFLKCVKQGHGTQVTVIVCETFVSQRCLKKTALNLIYFLKIAFMNIQQNIRHKRWYEIYISYFITTGNVFTNEIILAKYLYYKPKKKYKNPDHHQTV